MDKTHCDGCDRTPEDVPPAERDLSLWTHGEVDDRQVDLCVTCAPHYETYRRLDEDLRDRYAEMLEREARAIAESFWASVREERLKVEAARAGEKTGTA